MSCRVLRECVSDEVLAACTALRVLHHALRFGVVHPYSGHNYELRYWLAASGIDPDNELDIVVLPPPDMADALAAGQIDGYDDAAHALARGTWFEFSEAGGVQYRCKLSWVSPMRTRFLFTNREGHDAFVRSEREVAAMLRMGTLQQLDQAPIISRALDKLMADSEGQNQLAA